MLQYLKRWRQRRLYLARQSTIQSCAVYVVDKHGLVLPTIATLQTFPEAEILKQLCVSLEDTEALGAAIVLALDHAAVEQKKTRDTADYTSAKVRTDFLEGMERYRNSLGVAKRRFESGLELIGITRQSGTISFNLNNRSHGRFAYEGTRLESGKASISALASKSEIGAAVKALYEAAVKST